MEKYPFRRPNNRSSDRGAVESERPIENLHKNHPG